MLKISFQEYKTLPNKSKYIFVFTMDGYCGLCKMALVEYEKSEIPHLIQVDADSEEELMREGIPALPMTVILDKEEHIVWKKFGVLFSTQIEEMLKVFKESSI